jgi:hypothetical protein
LIPNVQNSVYISTLLDASRKKPIIPHVFVPFTKNVMEQNLVGFPNSMFLHIGPYIPYFGFGYSGIGSVFIMWPPMSNPFANIMAPPKLVLGVAQIGVVTNHEEPLNEDNDSSKRKHNPRMPQIVPTRKPYNERRGRPSG